jgi:hypothetical protein
MDPDTGDCPHSRTAAPYLLRVPPPRMETIMMLHKFRIALALPILALAAISAVDRVSAATAIEYGLISALVLQVPEQEVFASPSP